MAQMNFNTPAGSRVQRKLLVLYLNTGTASSPNWKAIGKRVEDSSMEYDWNEEAVTDIYGDTYVKSRRPIITQSFEPCELDGGDSAQLLIWNQAIRAQNLAAMTNNDLLLVHAYAGDPETGVFAERYPASMVKPSGFGGSSHIGMKIDVTFGGKRAAGTALISDGTVVFDTGLEQLGRPTIYLESDS